MGELDPSSAKYVITATLSADGVVEKSDVVGAIFGQTEGLLGPELDLRQLQMRGKVGRIHVSLDTSNGSSKASIRIPCSVDSTRTAIIAASLETIERVGPCIADLTVDSVEDVRVSKRDYIVDRAKEILTEMRRDGPRPDELSERVGDELAIPRVTMVDGMPAGPDVQEADDIIVVEGRADVRSLLEAGLTNAVAVEGTSMPDALPDLVADKDLTVFIDGDRGGELILRELGQSLDIDYVTRAPDGQEVEELSPSAVRDELRDKQRFTEAVFDSGEDDADDDERKEIELTDTQREVFSRLLDDLIGTRAAYLLDDELQAQAKVPVTRVDEQLGKLDGIWAIVFDGSIDPEIAEVAASHDVSVVVGMECSASLPGVVCCARDEL